MTHKSHTGNKERVSLADYPMIIDPSDRAQYPDAYEPQPGQLVVRGGKLRRLSSRIKPGTKWVIPPAGLRR